MGIRFGGEAGPSVLRHRCCAAVVHPIPGRAGPGRAGIGCTTAAQQRPLRTLRRHAAPRRLSGLQGTERLRVGRGSSRRCGEARERGGAAHLFLRQRGEAAR